MKRLTGVLLIAVVMVGGYFLLQFGYQTYMKVAYPVKYEEYITKYAKQYEVDPLLVLSVIRTESNFYEKAVSSADARGLMQLRPDTFEWAKSKAKSEESPSVEELFDPEVNIHYGIVTLKTLLDEFEHTDVALCAYHAGRGNVKKWLQKPDYSDDGKTLKQIPYNDTESYVRKIKETIKIYRKLYETEDSAT